MAWKTTAYRDGLVTFRIPEHWVEEYEPDGLGAYYAPGRDTPTLRLEVLSLQSGSPVTAETPRELLVSRGEVHPLANGDAYVAYQVPFEERGRQLIMHRWEIATAIPPNSARLAMFALTTFLEEQAELVPLLADLGREILACRLARD